MSRRGWIGAKGENPWDAQCRHCPGENEGGRGTRRAGDDGGGEGPEASGTAGRWIWDTAGGGDRARQ